jgi:hypothetical protein
MAFRISRFGYASGRPPGLASGTKCLINSHSLSLRSVGYGCRVFIFLIVSDHGQEMQLFGRPLRGDQTARFRTRWYV